MRLIIYSCVSLAFIMIACSKEISISLPEFEKKPVVNCLFSIQKAFQATLSWPGKPDETSYTYIVDAVVNIQGDDGNSFQLNHTENGIYTNQLAMPLPGVNYTLTVIVNGYPQLEASSKIPLNQTRLLTYSIEERKDAGSGEADLYGNVRVYQNIGLKLNNDLEAADYMGVSVIHNQVVYYYRSDSTGDTSYVKAIPDKYQQGYIESEDLAILTEGLNVYDDEKILLFRDITYSNESETLNIKVYSELQDKYWLKFFQFSPECFQYLKTLIIHEYTQSYDFWEVYEPIDMYSNIENGYGIFAGYTLNEYELEYTKNGEIK